MFFDANSIIIILLAAIIGGIIGLERESVNRPAGLRTHILVCIAAALIMDVNIKMSLIYNGTDPTRLGAQVISGIGFLGAGTIIREGPTVRGLTTAASLWAVACLGLVIGTGHYANAIFAMLVILITLKTFSQFEKKFNKNRRQVHLTIRAVNHNKLISEIAVLLGQLNCNIHKLDSDVDTDLQKTIITVAFELSHGIEVSQVISKMKSIEGIVDINQD